MCAYEPDSPVEWSPGPGVIGPEDYEDDCTEYDEDEGEGEGDVTMVEAENENEEAGCVPPEPIEELTVCPPEEALPCPAALCVMSSRLSLRPAF